MKRLSYYFIRALSIFLLILCAFGFAHATGAQADTVDTFGLDAVGENISVSTDTSDLRVTVVRIINIALGFLGLVAVLIVLYGGYLYMTSRGDEEKVGSAKKLLINGAIGLAIILASFGITSFILSRLQGAISGDGGVGGGGSDPTIEGSCSEPGTPYYEQYHNTSRCAGFCSLYPLQCCTAENFVVKSITPHTPDVSESTQMNNVVVRVLFSKKVAGNPQDIFKVYRKDNGANTDISDQFNFSFGEDGSLVEATPKTGAVSNGEYTIQVNDGIKDVSGRTLTEETSCGTFSRSGGFRTGDLGDQNVSDTTFGVLDPVMIGGNTGDDVYVLIQGREYPIKTTLRDDRGNGYAYLRIYKEGNTEIILEEYLDGPRLIQGSTQPFDFNFGFRITSKFVPGVVYIAEVIAHDIDGNIRSDVVRFKTITPLCVNGVIDPGEGPEADQGGSCGSPEGNSCNSNSDCGQGLRCLDSANHSCTSSGVCTCKPTPYISSVEYMNGASGSWVTILGKNFGNTPGLVKFEYDFNGNGTVDSSVTASLAQCREGRVWNNSWIIAEVPPPIEVSNQGAGIIPLEIVGGVKNDAELNGASSVSIFQNYAYVTAQQSGYLHIFDISSGTNPQLVGKVQIPFAFYVHTVGNYAYVVNGSSLRIVDVSDKSNPVVVGSLVDPQLLLGARGVYVSGNYAYVTNEIDTSFRIIDISNKTQPVVVGGIKDASLFNAARNVFVIGNYAYVTSYFDNSLRIINVSNKNNPVVVGGIKDDTNLFHISGLAVVGRYAYVTSFDRNSVVVIDILNPSSPQIVGSVQDNINLVGPFSISISGTQGFVANRRGNSVAVLDLSNSEQPRIVGSIKNDSELNETYGIASSGKYAYVANFSDRSIRIIDAKNIGTQLANNPIISVSDFNGLSDSTNDNFGPNLGTFTYNTTVRPNLCSVVVSDDRSLTLDDGTAVIVRAGDRRAPVGVPVTLAGKSFGDSRGEVTFGVAEASAVTWSGEIINSEVPFGGEGDVSVYVTSDSGEKSNPVPFTISSIANLRPPTITSIDPAQATKGSYITITGSRFGNDGLVYFTQTEGGTCPGAGCVLASRLPQSCGDTWSDTQVIAKVPTDVEFGLGRYFVVVAKKDGDKMIASSGKDSVEVIAGPARPSICRIDPVRGFAPIGGNDTLTIYGENFITNSQVKFWYSRADREKPDTWLSTSLGVTEGGASIIGTGPEKIKTNIPYDTNSGLSMSSGPIKIKNSPTLFSNSVNYEVLDCRASGAPKMDGFQCCTEGPEAGQWKQGNFACEGSSREAGYVWRFTTGKAPQKFFVVESCSTLELPSPSPSTLWNDGKNVCLNAQLQVRFNLPVNVSTVVNQSGDLSNVVIATCLGDDSKIDCGNSDVITPQFTVLTAQNFGANTLVFRKKDGTNLAPNTWYRIGLTKDVSSLRSEEELGQSVSKSEKLQATRGCSIGGVDAAYCFDFRTGPSEFMCTLVGAGIHPPEYTTTLLGVVQDPRARTVFDISSVFNISQVKPLIYGVYGKTNLACVSMNVENKPWDWGPTTSQPATAEQVSTSSRAYGYATAWEHKPDGSEIFAKFTQENQNPSLITATSTLKIDLGNPYAKNVWPLCLEACVNAEIGIEFNQIMDIDTFDPSKVTLRKCQNESCDPAQLGSSIPLVVTPDSQSNTVFRAYPFSALQKNTWYLVDLGTGVRAVGGITLEGETKLGTSAATKQWKFRTKNSEQLCLADRVNVLPDPFYSTFIGQAQLYKAFPLGSPDSCSPYGQQLNPWNYGWNWSVENTNVATVTNLSFGGLPKSTCSIGCTPRGSDISRVQNNEFESGYPVCGDGIKESGEDCDIAIFGEVPGVSCTYSCVRPGNTNKGEGPLQCGNKIVDTTRGEECDPKQLGAIPGFCSDTCTNVGSSQIATGDVSIPVCGSGEIKFGEDCDITDPTTQHNCSEKCLNIGTPLAQSWCDGWLVYSKNPLDASPQTQQKYSQVTEAHYQQVCTTAFSVCGNGIIEQGEECDSSSPQCSDRCVVQNACGTSFAQCAFGQEGCLSDCTLKGSSIAYPTPSVCGDGIIGIGEYDGNSQEILSCELPIGQSRNPLGGNPVQVVTSVGKAGQSSGTEVVPDMETKILTETRQALNNEGKLVSITPVSGVGEYHLQCGFTEYSQPLSDGSYNNCPVNEGNIFGVAANSCCIKRPERIAEYPENGSGIVGTPVCRNTYISVTFDQNIPFQNIQNNIKLAESHPQGFVCADNQAQDITIAMNDLLQVEHNTHSNFFARVWNAIKNFFARTMRIRVLALDGVPLPNDVVWCTPNAPIEIKTSYETNTDGAITSTKVSIYPTQAFEANQYVAVLLEGGVGGIKNVLGVSIKAPHETDLSDYWIFKTGADVCKIKEISVSPESALFTVANSSKDFVATAISTNNDQFIVSLPGQYEWVWNWGPQGDNIFDIPETGIPANYDTITSKGVRGHTDGVVQARVTKDIFPSNNQEGKAYTQMFSLDALFCQRPWPSTDQVHVSQDGVVSTDTVFEDSKYNFSLFYCADSGNPLQVSDDLPYFGTIEVVTNPQELGLVSQGDLPQALRRYLLFTERNDDAIGIQIFANPIKTDGSRQTLEEWYIDKFDDLSGVKRSSVAGYDALTNDYNVYVNAFNLDGDSIYNNVYLFSIDTNATPETKLVFQQLINSLRFNINLSNYGRCLKDSIPANVQSVRDSSGQFVSALICTTDFDCRDSSGAPKSGTNGLCSNATTKFRRDVVRLEQVRTAQTRIDSYFARNQNSQNFELSLSSGTYIPGYTNTKWPSWGKLGSLIGGAPIDPVNQWVGCGGNGYDGTTCWNTASTTFRCPVYSQTYEYKYNTATKDYTYYAPFEFVQKSDSSFVSQYLDADRVVFGPSCAPQTIISAIGGQCGDGNINLGEECDPPGRSIIVDNACTEGTYATATCQANCTYPDTLVCSGQGAFCGNNKVEGIEECDAGSENGQYGSRCTAQCQVSTAQNSGQFCGNGVLDKNAQGNYVEFCEKVDNACVYINQTTNTVIKPRIHIILDRSASMNTDVVGTNQDRWTQALAGLDQIYTSMSGSVNFSLSVFSGTGALGGGGGVTCQFVNGNFQCTNNPPVNIEVSAANCYKDLGALTALPSQVLDTAHIIPSGATPAKCAFEQILANQNTIFGTNNASTPKKVIVITDGKPSDATVPQDVGSIIQQLANNSISTYVIGFGNLTNATDINYLNAFAEAGGTGQYYPAEKSSELISAIQEILSCQEYSASKFSSCTWNCQNYGQYCGDGLVQQQFGEQCEPSLSAAGTCNTSCRNIIATGVVCGNTSIEVGEQCDDGNQVSGDGCSQLCVLESTASAPQCGNNKQDVGEQCDTGSNNGKICTPGYGTSCTYCNNDCSKVITVDAVAYCGNGKVDYTSQITPLGLLTHTPLERCDYSGSNVFVYDPPSILLGLPGSVTIRCDDKGTYTCSNSCQQLDNTCVTCGAGQNLPAPKIAVLNPMVEFGKWPQDYNLRVDLYRQYPSTGDGTTVRENLGTTVIGRSRYVQPLSYTAFSGSGLETNLLCSEDYVVSFNSNQLNTFGQFGDPAVDGDGIADLFPYPVHGETSQINNEIIVSPAVATDTIRIVVRWNKTDDQVLFMGELYQDKENQSSSGVGNTFSYFANVGTSGDKNCGEMVLSGGYYMPSNCNPTSPSLWMHKILTPSGDNSKIGAQSITISANGLTSNNPLGFYVTAVSGISGDAPINYLLEHDVWVDVYVHHPGQNSRYSIYKPTYSYSLNKAIPTANPAARYWHVFNLTNSGIVLPGNTEDINAPDQVRNGEFQLLPVGTDGAIVTNQCEVRRNMPQTTKCPA